MRVALLSQYFDPEPTTKLNSLTRGLVGAGHMVEVLTGIPNWPNGRYYDGYKPKLIQEEERLGARVVRTFVWPYRGNVTCKRLLNYGSFAVSALLGAGRLDRCDVLYVYHPPLTIGVPAYLISARRRVPFVYDVQDLWPEAGLAGGAIQPGPLYRSMSVFARWVYGRATHVTVIAPDFRNALIQQGVPSEKISVIPNWADDTIYAPCASNGVRDRYGLPEEAFLAMYAGNIGTTHGVDCLLKAASLLREMRQIAFVFVGTGADYEKMLGMKRQLRLDNVTFLGYIQPIHMPELLAAADLMVIHVRRSPSGAVSLPSRMLAYMACARPMLVASEGAPRQLVEKAACGVTCEPENPAAIADEIVRLAQQPDRLAEMARNGRGAYLSEFSEQVVVNRLITLIEKVGSSRATHDNRPNRDIG